MRKYKWFACLVMICLIAMGLPGCNSTPSPSLFTIDPTHSYSFEGWGTSLAWWAEVVGQWSDATKRAALEDALFNPDTGLGLNVIRYNFGASTSNDHCSPNSFRIGGNVPTYQPRLPSSGDNGYDWTQDQAQLTVLKEARDRGANIFEGFANSAPAWMLKNDCPQGNGGSNNLSPTHEEDYAHYLATIVQHFHNDFGITFQTVESFNEPDLGWKSKPKDSQEGMHVDLSQQEIIIHDLHMALQQNGALSYTSISAPDDNNIDHAVNDYNAYNPITKSDLSQLNTHGYNGSQRDALYQLGQQSGKRVWMSEDTTDGTPYLGPLCIQSNHNTTPTNLFSALELSCKIGRDMRSMHPQAWVYWQAVESSDDPGNAGCHSNKNGYGLLQTPFCQSTQMFEKTKQYYAMAQYSKFIRPGYKIIGSNDPNAVVAYDPSSHALVIVETNNDPNTPRTVKYDLSNLNNTFRTAMPYLTSASENIAQQSSIPISNKQFMSIVPPNSITTYVITGASVSQSPTTVPMPPTQTSCPASGTARAAVMAPLALGAHQNIVYYENASPDGTSGTLKRYDVTTHQATDIVKKPDAYIFEAQVSADGQWVLFISSVNGQPALQMVRMDGQGLQTLYCAPSNLTSPNPFSSALSNLVWSTDEQMVIFDQQGSTAPPTYLLLNLATGAVQIELQIDPNSSLSYTPRVWIDDTHLALFAGSSSGYSQETSIYVLDTHNGANQHTNVLQRIVTASTSCFDFDISTDHTKFFLYRCTDDPSQSSRQGPSSISVIPVTGGTEHTIFTAQTLAVLGLRVISDSGLLLLVGTGGANSGQNGLYTMHIDGTNFAKFVGYDIFGIEARAMIFGLNESSPYPWSVVSRDGKMYAVVLVSDCGMHCQYTLLFGSLSGGKVTSLAGGLANSFGMVGWTIM